VVVRGLLGSADTTSNGPAGHAGLQLARYFSDEDGHTNELFTMEQVGCRASASRWILQHLLGDREASAGLEDRRGLRCHRDGVDPASGSRDVPHEPGTFDVGGVLLPRPFSRSSSRPAAPVRRGHRRRQGVLPGVMGFRVTERSTTRAALCVLRVEHRHHSVGLFPSSCGNGLRLSHTAPCSPRHAVGGYRQLRDARRYLLEHG